MHPDAKTRFSDRVENYVKYRPGYPSALAGLFTGKPPLKIADIASGTGLFTEVLLRAGHEVFGVEPNSAMREAGEDYLREFSRFHSVNGGAEATGLPEKTFDYVTAAQAFHWFDPLAARAEFLRILKPAGRAAIIWNNRETKSEFGKAYENFLNTMSIDYAKVRAEPSRSEASKRTFFGPAGWELHCFDNKQVLDWTSLWGRYQSTSYSPKAGDAKLFEAERELKAIFDRFSHGGNVEIIYASEVYLGRPS